MTMSETLAYEAGYRHGREDALDTFSKGKIGGYPALDLLKFAEACRAEGVTNDRLRYVVEDITWGMTYCKHEMQRAWENSVEEIRGNTLCHVATAYVPPINLKRYGISVDDWVFEQMRKEQTDADN